MLDFAHGLVLRAVAKDPSEDQASPALDDLLACRIVVRTGNGLEVTDIGQEILRRSVKSRRELWLLRLVALGLAVSPS